MKKFIFLLTIFLLNTLVYSDEESGCLIDDDQPRIAIGETIDIEGLCQTITCVSDNNINIESCAAVMAAPPGPGYYLTQHFEKSFPDCCPVYEEKPEQKKDSDEDDDDDDNNAIKKEDKIDNE